jgi:gas vesicle protein
MNNGKLLLGVLAGVAAGAVLGILFAPEKGSVTRRKIAKKGSDCAEAVKDRFHGIIEGFTENFKSLKEEIGDFAEQKLAETKESEKKS